MTDTARLAMGPTGPIRTTVSVRAADCATEGLADVMFPRWPEKIRKPKHTALKVTIHPNSRHPTEPTRAGRPRAHRFTRL